MPNVTPKAATHARLHVGTRSGVADPVASGPVGRSGEILGG